MNVIKCLSVISFSITAFSAAAQDQDIGEALYQEYCAVCHGSNAKGGGSLTELLTVDVPKLTDLAKNNDGEFPMLDVVHIIDGRTGVRGHGGPMPTFGAVFNDEMEGAFGRYGSVLETRGRIMSLALYLESVQE